ncbi:phytanoyl-CoA dioxygenase [Nostoc sp. FACHB-152]|uniref:phytanoyl-CoA dioxygenase n=1 Tax=unclassified Nostoc TaxID=2593658 RepID=UPI001686DD82|nr:MULTISPECIES: phytanoyl-CoA dioxygenase [unclassified Nostoc]MBD2448985.1 phytanoyl-CoA dioxygenase [Nostoc sp. FACHB-152]MBD2469453.1 phytanoyl-CoA dioxygenase [Nostoc sp. FACHB-145]
MIDRIQSSFSAVQHELNYQRKIWQHRKNLPILEKRDRQIIDTLNRDGIYITNLADLGIDCTAELLNAASKLLPNMGKTNYNVAQQNHPEIYIVTDIPAFYDWGRQPRLLNILENYIGLPVAYHGVHLRKDFPNESQFATLLWHRDIEDRKILKIIVYLTDVEEKHGPFEYVPLALTSKYQLNYYRIQAQINNSGGIDDKTLNQIIPKSAWKSCPGRAGTVIVADTRKLLHHGTLRTEERSTLFFAYTANPPKQPHLCTHYWDNTYPRPTVEEIAEVKVGTLSN